MIKNKYGIFQQISVLSFKKLCDYGATQTKALSNAFQLL